MKSWGYWQAVGFLVFVGLVALVVAVYFIGQWVIS